MQLTISKTLRLLYYSRGLYFRSSMVPENGVFYLNGKRRILKGEHYLSMLDEIIFRDSYQLKKIQNQQINTIVDVGANIGIFSLWASLLFPKAHVYAFEPNSEILNLFNENLAGIPNCKLENVALSSIDGVGDLDVSGMHTASFLTHIDKHDNGKSITCKVLSLNSFRKTIDTQIDLLKLDCEGSEYDILLNSKIDDISCIVGELHTTKNNTPFDAINFLRINNFDVQYHSFIDEKAGIFFAKNKLKNIKYKPHNSLS